MEIVYRDGGPAVDLDQLATLFVEAGWQARAADRTLLEALVRSSRFVVSAWDGGALVGFARAISDGVTTAYVNDVVVRGDYRKRGIGFEVVRRLMAERDEIKFVLHAAPPVQAFYAKLGFVEATNMLVRRRASEVRFQLRSVDAESFARRREEALASVRAIVPRTEVREVGSTAVPGVLGKQDIDILVRATRETFEGARDALDSTFARNPEQLSNAEFQGYIVSKEPDIAVQLTIAGSANDTFDAFAEALRADPELVARYNALKRRWNGEDMKAYREAKARFIEEALTTSRSKAK